jgi:hypothetical protein
MNQQKLIETNLSVVGLEDDMAFKYDQFIPDNFLSRIKDQRFDMAKSRESEFMEVADVPMAVADKWKREGFDMMDTSVSAAMIVKKLRDEKLDAFISTNKKV